MNRFHYLLGFIAFIAFATVLVCLVTAIVGYAPRAVLVTFVVALVVMVAVGVYFICTMLEDEMAPDPLGADRPVDRYRHGSADSDVMIGGLGTS